MAIGLAFKAFFKLLFDSKAAEAVRTALGTLEAPESTSVAADRRLTGKSSTGREADVQAAPERASPVAKATGRSDALTLLSTLQREARFLDLVGESLEGFDDAQVGAAARQVIADVRKSLDRMFAIGPLTSEDEGSDMSIPKPASPVRYHIVGKSVERASRGTVVHRGWKVERCQTPTWNGDRDDAFVLSPVEIEVDG